MGTDTVIVQDIDREFARSGLTFLIERCQGNREEELRQLVEFIACQIAAVRMTQNAMHSMEASLLEKILELQKKVVDADRV